MTCDDATYNDKRRQMLKVPGPVTFTRGRHDRHGTGATYDRDRDVLWLLADAQVDVPPDDKGSGAIHATSAPPAWRSADHYMTPLDSSARRRRRPRRSTPTTSTATLTPDDEKVQQHAAARQQPHRRQPAAAAPAGCRRKDIDMTYADDGRTLQSAKLVEQSVVRLPGDSGSRQADRRQEHRHGAWRQTARPSPT